ncbi:hypothetical protein ACLB2K_059945 [Fragaria x ananassa]
MGAESAGTKGARTPLAQRVRGLRWHKGCADSADREGHGVRWQGRRADSAGTQGSRTPLAQRARRFPWQRRAWSPLAQRRADSIEREGRLGEARSEEEGEAEGEEEGEAEGRRR